MRRVAQLDRNAIIKTAQGYIKYVDDGGSPLAMSIQDTYDLCQHFLICAGSVELAVGVGSDDPHDYDQIDAFAGDLAHLRHLDGVLSSDRAGIETAEQNYRASWKLRGGVGAFMMLARKWDRLQNRVKEHGWDIFKAIAEDKRREGVIDDVRDLRRYLTLVECEMVEQKAIEVEGTTKDSEG
jgi:hypothetical protein